ncbi:MAG: methylated-DNA--[protein]-cysteine S-methyltransferase [Clostridiales bacterium]|nr:methylated-DNA--[protein]-cysteine S-methyltransferase [Clostridiales bacterium]
MINFAYYKIELGTLRIGYEDNAIIIIDFVKAMSESNVRSELTDKAYCQICEYFNGQRFVFDIPIKPKGTEFQQKVWKALCEIPYGETRTYGEIAAAVGNPKACRAVGMANHCNPICIVIPCHRVIGANGSLTGYAEGLSIKAALLKIEAENYIRENRNE